VADPTLKSNLSNLIPVSGHPVHVLSRSYQKPKDRTEDMRLSPCLRLLRCTAVRLRSTAGPVATARPCRPTTLHLRQQHGGAAHTHYLVLTCTRCLCSAQQKWRYPSLSPTSILLSQVQGPEPLRPERRRPRKKTDPAPHTSAKSPTNPPACRFYFF
jgi:hypothetical protein